MNGANKTAIVVGGGVGGLASAIQLARAGVAVKLFERAERLGGKLGEVDVGGRRFPAGPSVFTMRWVFEELFAPRKLTDYLQLEPVDPLCRHFFADGTQLDLFADEERSRQAIERFAGPASARGYTKYRKHAAKIFDIVRGPFMERPVPSVFEFMSPRAIYQFTQIDGMRTLHRALEDFFPDLRLRQLFGRYATYNGSSPYHAPATLSVIAHVENAFGIFACRGGIGRLAAALEQLARELGVELHTSADVEGLVTESCENRGKDEQVTGVRLRGGVERADVVVANCDVAHVYERLLERARPVQKPAEKYASEERSLSAYVLLAVVDRAPIDLLHHNVFFSTHYAREFEELLSRRRPPEDPTVYLCADDRVAGEPRDPDGAERAFLLTNAPPRDGKGAAVDWAHEAERCRERILRTLERHGWPVKIRAFVEQTPVDFERRFPHSQGALYGLASNSKMAAFKRPPNQIPGLGGLYLAGGTVHPGAGLPMVCLSAKMATQLALQELHGERNGR